jgi:DNA primase
VLVKVALLVDLHFLALNVAFERRVSCTACVSAPYSPRAVPWAGVSMPLRWDELDQAYPADFTLLTAPERLAATGDLWASILDRKCDLAGLLAGSQTSQAA